MITVGYIKKEGDIHYYYSVVNEHISVNTYEGPDGMMSEMFSRLKASALLALCEDFLSIDSETPDRGKDVQVYEELKDRMKAYMTWGHENLELSAGKICDYGSKAEKYMDGILNLIDNSNAGKKDLIFLRHCVTLTMNASYEPNKE